MLKFQTLDSLRRGNFYGTRTNGERVAQAGRLLAEIKRIHRSVVKTISECILPLISQILPKLTRMPNLTTAILYGSAVRGEPTETSDIDLMLIFNAPHNPEIGGELEAAHRILSETKTERKLQIVPTNKQQALEPDFLDNISREGIIIYGEPIISRAKVSRAWG